MDSEIYEGMQESGVDEHVQKKKSGKINLDDDSLINELNFCYSDSSTSSLNAQAEQFKDTTVLIRGANNQIVNKILGKMHFDFDPKTW